MYRTFDGYMFHLANDVVLKDPTAEQDFHIKDPAAALRKLRLLQTQGFGVPQYAIDSLEREINEFKKER
jgi:hypothetical protein